MIFAREGQSFKSPNLIFFQPKRGNHRGNGGKVMKILSHALKNLLPAKVIPGCT